VDLIMRIGGDPASWIVRDGDYEGLIAQLSQATAPVVIGVSAPVGGRLVLSPRAAGSVVILQPPGGVVWEPRDWNPGGAIKPTVPIVYLSLSAGGSLYALSGTVESQSVVDDIVAAMSDDTKRMLTLPVYDSSGEGVLVIDGATLPFAVVG
jgi:hypothetical protein